jgi:hypothetical protein
LLGGHIESLRDFELSQTEQIDADDDAPLQVGQYRESGFNEQTIVGVQAFDGFGSGIPCCRVGPIVEANEASRVLSLPQASQRIWWNVEAARQLSVVRYAAELSRQLVVRCIELLPAPLNVSGEPHDSLVIPHEMHELA